MEKCFASHVAEEVLRSNLSGVAASLWSGDLSAKPLFEEADYREGLTRLIAHHLIPFKTYKSCVIYLKKITDILILNVCISKSEVIPLKR